MNLFSEVFEVQSFGLDTSPQSFCHLFVALSIIHCSKSDQKFAVPGVSRCYCRYGNHAAGSKPIQKCFIVSIKNSVRILLIILVWAFHPRDTQAYWSSFKYFRQTRQHLEADRIEFTDEDTALQCPCHLRTVIWLWDMDSPEGWWTAIRSIPHELPTTDLRNPLVPFCYERLGH